MMKIQHRNYRTVRLKAACWTRISNAQRFLSVVTFMGIYSVIVRYDESGRVYLGQYLDGVLAT